jgi:Ca2+-binding EF-hand superfamily protein
LAGDLTNKQKVQLSIMFEMADKNQDGKVTDSELEQFKAKHVIPSEETNES